MTEKDANVPDSPFTFKVDNPPALTTRTAENPETVEVEITHEKLYKEGVAVLQMIDRSGATFRLVETRDKKVHFEIDPPPEQEATTVIGLTEPVPMILHCPKCGLKHIDAPDPSIGWDNRPHKSHMCAGCGCIWRPADITTVGVEAIETKGTADNFEGQKFARAKVITDPSQKFKDLPTGLHCAELGKCATIGDVVEAQRRKINGLKLQISQVNKALSRARDKIKGLVLFLQKHHPLVWNDWLQVHRPEKPISSEEYKDALNELYSAAREGSPDVSSKD